MRKILERWAIQFLEDQGFIILPRTFIGIALGYGVASGKPHNMRVVFPDHVPPMVIAMNSTILNLKTDDGKMENKA